MSSMTYEQSEDMQFDDSHLISGQSAQQVPSRKSVKSIEQIFQNIIKNDSIPKEDLRRRWNIKKSEREKLVKQRNKANESLEYWLSKMQWLKYELKRNAEELEQMKGRMIADCMSED